MRLVTSRPTLFYEPFEQRVPFPTQIKICYCDLRQYLRYLYGALGYTSYVNKKIRGIGHVKQKILQEMGRKQNFSKIQSENEISKLWNMLDLEHFASKLFFQPPLKIFWCVLWQCWRYLEGALNLAECASKKIGVIRRVKRDIFRKTCRGGKT